MYYNIFRENCNDDFILYTLETMKILAIETSCDETAIAILKAEGGLENPSFEVLGNSLVSQIELHKEFGGVYPNLARREHAKNLVPILLSALGQASLKSNEGSLPDKDTRDKIDDLLSKEPELLEKFKKEIFDLKKPEVDCIAVTSGPGLEPALWVGIVFAEALGALWGLPVLPVNHMEGHIYSPLYKAHRAKEVHEGGHLEFPALALLVSGGHTELVYIKDFGSYEIIGKTRDDAVGEAFDKAARLLGLPYPGGPEISALSEINRARSLAPTFKLPRPMINSDDFDFSYSGLKTAVLYRLKGADINLELQEEVSRAFEDAAVEVLISKTKKALSAYDARTLIVAGGVSQNKHLRSELGKLINEFEGIDLLLPENQMTTDNAVMIAIAAYINILKGKGNLQPNSPLRIKAEGSLSL